ncbi:hypothetical protein PsAD26_02528 [Pseudovibrio sp. Ad26]|nr:hypothetical protein PsAD26_02528 [Pseudovibrio sp. Ad26]
MFANGEGDLIEGPQVIGRGEDLLSVLAPAVTEEGVSFASNHFPEETASELMLWSQLVKPTSRI